ncbi:4468_t:CDS:2 [Entrophospora sp. SA101]|nr:4468_t:CDS:2 [Entrophospora sp. SA101]
MKSSLQSSIPIGTPMPITHHFKIRRWHKGRQIPIRRLPKSWQKVMTLKDFIERNWHLQQGNDPKYTSRVVKTFIAENHSQILEYWNL